MQQEKAKLTESPLFMGGLTAVAGFCGAYSTLLYGTQSNGQTGNTMKLGITLAQGNFPAFLQSFCPLMACLAGVILCDVVRESGNHPNGNWHKRTLLVELLALVAVGFLPGSTPALLGVSLMAMISGFQLNMFRAWYGGVHNTTICPGALRSLGHFIFSAFTQRNAKAIKTCLSYLGIFLCFPVGAALCTLLCPVFATRSVWFAALLVALWVVWVWKSDLDA